MRTLVNTNNNTMARSIVYTSTDTALKSILSTNTNTFVTILFVFTFSNVHFFHGHLIIKLVK